MSPAEKRRYRHTRYFNRVLAAEVSTSTRYYDRVVQCAPVVFDEGDLLALVDNADKSAVSTIEELPDLSGERRRRSAVLFNGNLNFSLDIQDLLSRVRPKMSRTSRIIAVAYNPYLKWLFRTLSAMGLSRSGNMTTFVTESAISQIASLAGFEIIRSRPCCHMPFKLLGLGSLVNRVLPAIPILRRLLALAEVIMLRPELASADKPSISIVIPARNEAGSIRRAIEETPQMPGVDTEIIFVEGHSADDTWEVIREAVGEGHDTFRLSCYQQPGKGKVDAVRLGFSKANNEILTILDADLTMPPEMLPRFYEAYTGGHADFVNGSRLLYPMEGEAMRFLNHLGNLFFAKSLSVLLGMQIGDSLCGTKLLAAHDYERVGRWHDDFGDFDPFGDFELLFSAAELGLGCVDIPVRYKARTYGSTNISRFRHGLVLLKMTLLGLFRIRMGKTS
ncbi:MAG: glycosyltransferase family 2 protein [bacterium]|nr:glycosyltransferase family 2 protein [bacterium]